MYRMIPRAPVNVPLADLTITRRQIIFAALLVAVLAASCPAQDEEIDNPRVAVGYSHLHLPFNRISIGGESLSTRRRDSFHRPGLWMELEWNPVPWLGISN